MSLRHRMLGEYFGYPKCCIDYFCNDPCQIRITTHQKAVKSLKYGYVPCDSCAKKVVEGRVEVQDLIQNRICISEFPHGRKWKIDESKKVWRYGDYLRENVDTP